MNVFQKWKIFYKKKRKEKQEPPTSGKWKKKIFLIFKTFKVLVRRSLFSLTSNNLQNKRKKKKPKPNLFKLAVNNNKKPLKKFSRYERTNERTTKFSIVSKRFSLIFFSSFSVKIPEKKNKIQFTIHCDDDNIKTEIF